MAALPVLAAPDSWRTLAFMSDVHLHPAEPATFDAWAHGLATGAWDALFILGDLFEVWVGDDVLADPAHGAFWRACADTLRQASQRMPVYFMPGNRDFLVGPGLLAATGMSALADPSVLTWGTQRWVLSHGDALCLADTPYQAFRAEVRTAAWQTAFLAQPLPERLALVRQMRNASEHRKANSPSWADVDDAAAVSLLQQANATLLIHGHTHMPAVHHLGACGQGAAEAEAETAGVGAGAPRAPMAGKPAIALTRRVLSDWDAHAHPPRLEVMCASRSLSPDKPATAEMADTAHVPDASDLPEIFGDSDCQILMQICKIKNATTA